MSFLKLHNYVWRPDVACLAHQAIISPVLKMNDPDPSLESIPNTMRLFLSSRGITHTGSISHLDSYTPSGGTPETAFVEIVVNKPPERT